MKKSTFLSKNSFKIISFTNYFSLFASKMSNFVGNGWTFIAVILIVILWGLAGPIFHYSETWQLIMNTASSIMTLLIVFIIQNTQNRDTMMLKIKLDELLRAQHRAKNSTINLEELTEKQLKDLEKKYHKLSKDKNPIPKI